MDKFNIPHPSGKHRLKAHDLNFIYDSLKAGFTALSLNNGNKVLYGLHYTHVVGAIVNYSSGWVMIAGEIYYYFGNGNINTGAIPDPVLVPVEAVMSPSPRTAGDGSSKNVHFNRYVRIEANAAQPIKFRLKELRHYDDPFHPIVPFGSGTDFDFAAGVAQTGSAAYQDLSVRKVGEELEISGACTIAAFASSMIILTLPEQFHGIDYRPLFKRSIVVAAKSGSILGVTNETMNVDFDQNGDVSVESGTYIGAGVLHLRFNHKIPIMY